MTFSHCFLIVAFLSNALFQFVTHLEDDTIGGLEASVTRMLEADPDFRKYAMNSLIFISHFTTKSILLVKFKSRNLARAFTIINIKILQACFNHFSCVSET